MQTKPLSMTGVLAIGLALLLAASIACTAQSSPPDEDIDQYVQAVMHKLRIPGLSLAVVQGDQVRYLRGYGIADTSNHPVTPQTPFILGSTSKAFTALAVMQLVDSGQVDLDAPVQTYLPWFHMKDAAAGRITVRQLLNHTSGIPAYAGNRSMSENNPRTDALEQQVRSLQEIGLAHAPGSTFEYSNANDQIAGLIVEQVREQPFGSLVEQRLFTPLEMKHSHTQLSPARADGLATGHVYWFGFPAPTGYLPFSSANVPSAYMISSAEDLSHFLIAQLNDGVYQNRAVVSPTSLALTHQAGLGNYGMGWFAEPEYDLHNGVGADYGSQILISRDGQYGIAVLFNANQNLSQSVFYQIGPGILQILQGGKPTVDTRLKDYRASLVMFGALLVFEMLGIRVSWAVMKRLQKRLHKQLRRLKPVFAVSGSLMILIDVGIVWFFLSRLEAGLVNTLIFQPDMSLLMLLFFAGIIGWGMVRTAWFVRLAMPSRLRVSRSTDPVVPNGGGS